MTSTQVEKANLRTKARTRLQTLGEDERRQISERICRQLARLSLLKRGKPVLAFHPFMRGEPDITPWLLDSLARGRTIALPRIDGEQLTPCQVTDFDELPRSSFGTQDPSPQAEAFDLEQLSAILVPGLAFQLPSGRRLGRGGGHYDRLLKRLPERCIRIGLCFETQLFRQIPAEDHDLPVHFLITELGLHHTSLRPLV